MAIEETQISHEKNDYAGDKTDEKIEMSQVAASASSVISVAATIAAYRACSRTGCRSEAV